MKQIAIAGLLLGATLAQAQENHFDGVKWRERETDHFFIRAEGTGYDPASKYAEKVWDVCVDVLPGLEQDFAKNEFRTPSGDKGAETAPFRFCIYLNEDGADFRHLIQMETKRSNWDDNHIKLVTKTGNFADRQARFTVFCKGNPTESAGGDRDMTSIMVHSTASTLLRSRGHVTNLPFWLQSGFGYYVEHMLLDSCRVHYLDFEAYYEKQNAEIKTSETLGADKEWPPVLRKLCKDDERCDFNEVVHAQILTLTPEQSGYAFALTYFLIRDEPAKVKFRKLVAEMRDGRRLSKDLILETYEYEDDAALEAEWYEWIESRKFK